MSNLPTNPNERKGIPLYSGVLKYFPDALCAVAECSQKGNDQHHPDKPLHWDKSKSTDEGDALLRHLVDAGTVDTDGIRHSAKVAWRALALLQRELDAEMEEHPFANRTAAAQKELDKFIGLTSGVSEKQHEATINDLRIKERAAIPLSREEIFALEAADQPDD
jgi:hypothetical protein